nr:hypothetical protein NCPCFENI_00689 [Cupriavidus sp.]
MDRFNYNPTVLPERILAKQELPKNDLKSFSQFFLSIAKILCLHLKV